MHERRTLESMSIVAAKRTVREKDFADLSYRQRVAFVETLLKTPTKPNTKLRKAAKRYAQIFQK
jgi:uncharacterized protein (DUF1778 family)